MRILVWNIQFFTNARITAGADADDTRAAANVMSALANLNHILSTVYQADADVFVILETRATQAVEVGALGRGRGPEGALNLLFYLRELNQNWCLVPPLVVNPQIVIDNQTYTETVAVFWRNDRATFTGPYAWPANSAEGPSIAPGSGPAGTYPSPWDIAVPPGTTAAAQCRFYKDNDRNKAQITFPDDKHRRPYLTTFREMGIAPRDVHLFSVHLTPAESEVYAAVTALGVAVESIAEPGGGGVTVVAGDFNVNLNAPTNLQSAALMTLTFAQPGLRRMGRDPVTAATLFQARRDATPARYLKKKLLDYAYVRYSGANPPAPQMLVVDRVRGVRNVQPNFTSDLRRRLADIQAIPVQPTVNVLPKVGAKRDNFETTITTTQAHQLQVGGVVRVNGVGGGTFDGDFTVASVPNSTTFTYAQTVASNKMSGGGTARGLQQEFVFRQLNNFGHIGPPAGGMGTSDHLPIFFIV